MKRSTSHSKMLKGRTDTEGFTYQILILIISSLVPAFRAALASFKGGLRRGLGLLAEWNLFF